MNPDDSPSAIIVELRDRLDMMTQTGAERVTLTRHELAILIVAIENAAAAVSRRARPS